MAVWRCKKLGVWNLAYKVYISEDITDPGKDFLREKGYGIAVGEDGRRETILKNLPDADAVIVRTAVFDADMLKAAEKLKVIAKYGVGYDNIDVKAAEALGIWVVNAPLSNIVSVSEFVIGALLYCVKHYSTVDRFIREGNYSLRTTVEGVELDGKTLGIVGVGRIGRLVARKAHFGLDMKIVGYDPYIDPEGLPDYIELLPSLEALFDRADYVTVHTPSTPETIGMIDKRLMSRLKRSAVVLNCARGGIVKERDLYEALSEGIIARAVVDVFRPEPPGMDNPLLTLGNILLTPHYAAITGEAGARSGLHAAAGVDEVLNGKVPTWAVNIPLNPRNLR